MATPNKEERQNARFLANLSEAVGGQEQSVRRLTTSVESIVRSQRGAQPTAKSSQATHDAGRVLREDRREERVYRRRSLANSDWLTKIEDEQLTTQQKTLKVLQSGIFKHSGMSGWGKLLGVGGLIGWLLTGKGEFLSHLLKGALKWGTLKTVLKGLTGFTDNIVKTFSKLTGGLFKGVFGGAAKAASKSGGKAALKKIPVLGAIFGLIFGIQRFREGDVVGGLLEFASGAASIFPGVGTIISGVIDGLLFFRDVNKLTGGKLGDATGKMIGSWFAPIGDWFTDVITSIKDRISLLILGIKNFVGEAWNKMIDLIPPGLQGIAAGVGLKKVDLTDTKADQAALIAKRNPGSANDPNSAIRAATRAKIAAGVAAGTATSTTPLKTSPVAATSQKVESEGVVGMNSQSIVTKDSSVDLTGMDPETMHRFIAMANEYFALTEKPVQINSAYRSMEEQAQLHRDYPDKAVRAGRSLHNYGFALDIQSDTANDMHGRGLFKKHGFYQPIKSKEPWHTEPTHINRWKVVEQGSKNLGDPIYETADAQQLNNMSMQIEAGKSDVIVVQLDEKTIAALAAQIGDQYGKHQPDVTLSSNINVDARA